MDNLLNHELQNKRIQESIISSIKNYFPVEAHGKKLEVKNVKVKDTLDSNDFPGQKDAKVNRKS